MAVLVTGAAGFIGAHVAGALAARGNEVIGLDDFNDDFSPWLKHDMDVSLCPDIRMYSHKLPNPEIGFSTFKSRGSSSSRMNRVRRGRVVLSDRPGRWTCDYLHVIDVIRWTLILPALVLICPCAAAQSVPDCSHGLTDRAVSLENQPALKANIACPSRTKPIADDAVSRQKSRLEPDKTIAETPMAPSSSQSSPTPSLKGISPIASNFSRSAFLVSGYAPQPPSAKPDNLGAFRFICLPSPMFWDDPILFPGAMSGSPHLHQGYGNTSTDYSSTYASLRTSGESTCSNKLNRSAYWVPALLNAAGKVIRPDYISIYYKRMPAEDPNCRKYAEKGCVGIPTGLRVVSGYDTRRMGQEQSENATYHHRCISPGKPSEHRATLAEAVKDCGGSGQIITAISFGNCWTGQIDSADHRSHLTHATYGNWGYPKCPVSHPYIIPELTQQLAYTIAPDDGEIYFASDRMNGIAMPGGSTFHADYMEAWDPQARDTWTANCIDKLLTCVDGELGDGTMLRRGAPALIARPRLVDVPARPAAR